MSQIWPKPLQNWPTSAERGQDCPQNSVFLRVTNREAATRHCRKRGVPFPTPSLLSDAARAAATTLKPCSTHSRARVWCRALPGVANYTSEATWAAHVLLTCCPKLRSHRARCSVPRRNRELEPLRNCKCSRRTIESVATTASLQRQGAKLFINGTGQPAKQRQ